MLTPATGAPSPTRKRSAHGSRRTGAIRSVFVVHNDISTGYVPALSAVRRAMDEAGHSVRLMVDAISSLAAMGYRQDEWGVDVMVAGLHKGLTLPPGLSFNASSEKAL